jgi:poly(beta-D-mannuronate) lyase
VKASLWACLGAWAWAGALPAAGTGTCPQVPTPIQDISANSYYVDAQHSVPDFQLKAENEAAVKPLESYLSQVSAQADRFVGYGDPAAAACGLGWLKDWARGSAILGQMSSHQAEYERKWLLCGLGLAYFKLESQASGEDRSEIEAWLNRLALRVETFEDRQKHHNNHYYWAALAAGAVGLACHQEAHWDWARKAYVEALQSIGPDGSLPLEMARGRKALAYHNYALAPLVLLAELARQKGEDWYALQGGALKRLVGLTLQGLGDPQVFQKLSGTEQAELPQGAILGWAEFYSRRFPHEGAETLLDPKKAPIYPKLGGDLRELAGKWVRAPEGRREP